MDKKLKIIVLIGFVLCILVIPGITLGSTDFLTVDTMYHDTAIGYNATYLITIENIWDETDTYDLRIINIDNASLAVLSQYNITLEAGQHANITLTVADHDTIGPYYINVNATSQSNPGLTDEVETITAVIED